MRAKQKPGQNGRRAGLGRKNTARLLSGERESDKIKKEKIFWLKKE
jgi:hypothetical protein